MSEKFFSVVPYFVSGQSGLVWIIVLVLVAAAAVIGSLFLYYKRRVATLKTEILAVQYSTDPQSYPDRHHFDNPVYAFQGTAGPSQSSGNARILNNLVKPNNLQGQLQQLMGHESSGSSTASGRAGAYSMNGEFSQKNLEADLTNPILYNGSVDESNVDHVYDEIKYKDECKDIGKWQLNIILW